MNNCVDEYKEVWKPVYSNFKQHYPHLSKKMVDWFPSGQLEITVTLNDGTMVRFDLIGPSLSYIYETGVLDDDYDEQYCKKQFSRNLSTKMKRMGMTQNELSKTTGISLVSLSKYVNGKALPTVYNLNKLSKSLRCSTSELTDIR